MSNLAHELAVLERRAARRLGRLFRLERAGRFARWPVEVVLRLLERRGALIDELERLEQRRRSLEPWTPIELNLAMEALAREVDRSQQHCLQRLGELGAELEQRRSASRATGLRDGADGRLLGQG